jgi:hypothetical protein
MSFNVCSLDILSFITKPNQLAPFYELTIQSNIKKLVFLFTFSKYFYVLNLS